MLKCLFIKVHLKKAITLYYNLGQTHVSSHTGGQRVPLITATISFFNCSDFMVYPSDVDILTARMKWFWIQIGKKKYFHREAILNL